LLHVPTSRRGCLLHLLKRKSSISKAWFEAFLRLDLCVCAFHFIIHSLLFHMMLMRFLSFDVHLICILHIPSQKAPILVAKMLWQGRTEFIMGMFWEQFDNQRLVRMFWIFQMIFLHNVFLCFFHFTTSPSAIPLPTL